MSLKKIFVSMAIGSVALAGIIVIGCIFGLMDFEGVVLNIVLSAVTLCVGSVFAINATMLRERSNKLVSTIGFALIGVSVLLFLLLIWVGGEVLFKAAIVIGVGSAFANIIMSNAVRLGYRFLVVQIVEYAMVFLIDIVIVLNTFDIDVLAIEIVSKLFVTVCIAAVVGVVSLSVLAKKQGSDDVALAMDDDMITISKEEYESLVEKARLYDEMMSSQDGASE